MTDSGTNFVDIKHIRETRCSRSIRVMTTFLKNFMFDSEQKNGSGKGQLDLK